MPRPMPPLPPDTCWIRKHGASAVFELLVRRIEVAEVERLADGYGLTGPASRGSERLRTRGSKRGNSSAGSTL